MTPYIHDGTVFDLDRVLCDVTGVQWIHTGEWADGEPLMRSIEGLGYFHRDGAVPLPAVYADHGPLLTLPGPIPAELKRAVLAGKQVAA